MNRYFLLTNSINQRFLYKRNPVILSELGGSVQMGSVIELLREIYLFNCDTPLPIVDKNQQIQIWSNTLKHLSYSGSIYQSEQYWTYYHSKCVSSFLGQINTTIKPQNYQLVEKQYLKYLEDYRYHDVEQAIEFIAQRQRLAFDKEIVSVNADLYSFLQKINKSIKIKPLQIVKSDSANLSKSVVLDSVDEEVNFCVKAALSNDNSAVILVPDNYLNKGIVELLLSLKPDTNKKYNYSRIINNYDSKKILPPIVIFFINWLDIFLNKRSSLAKIIVDIDNPLLIKDIEPANERVRVKANVLSAINFLNSDEVLSDQINIVLKNKLPKLSALISGIEKIFKDEPRSLIVFIDKSMNLLSTIVDLKISRNKDVLMLINALRSLRSDSPFYDDISANQYISLLKSRVSNLVSVTLNYDDLEKPILITSDVNDIDFISSCYVCGVNENLFPFGLNEDLISLYSISNDQLSKEDFYKKISYYPAMFISTSSQERQPLNKNTDIAQHKNIKFDISNDYIDTSENLLNLTATGLNYFADDPIAYYLDKNFSVNENYYILGMSPKSYGTVMHQILECIYRSNPVLDNNLNAGNLSDDYIAIIRKTVEDELSELSSKFFIESIILSIQQTIAKFLKEDLLVNADTYQLEKSYTLQKFDVPINIKVDRIDFIDDKYRIIDYKCTLNSTARKSITHWWEDKHFAPQLPIYSHLFQPSEIKEVSSIVFVYDDFKACKPKAQSSALHAAWKEKINHLILKLKEGDIDIGPEKLGQLKNKHPFLFALNEYIDEKNHS